MRFRLYLFKKTISELLLFIKYLPGYYKLHRDYLYEPDTYSFIIQNYEMVLCNTTKTMSKPTYHWRAVVNEIDRYYDEIYKEEK